MLLENGYVTNPEYSGKVEKSKIEFFDKIKTDDIDTISIVFANESPEIVRQATLFLNKARTSGFKTVIDGIYLQQYKTMLSKEYVKFNNNWVLFLEIGTDRQEGLEFTEKGFSNTKMAIALINGVNYITFEGVGKVFIVQNKFSTAFGFIDIEKVNGYMEKQPARKPYQLDNLEESALLIDSPAQLFAKDTVFYRDGDFLGVWISFGTLIKYDVLNLNNLNVDGTQVAIVEDSLSDAEKIKKIMENKSAGYASLIVNSEKLLNFLLKKAKQYNLDSNKMSGTKICTDDILYNLQEKGILGITYEKVDSIKEMYLPAFDYTTASVKEIVGETILFIYQDEYIWMNYSEEDKEIRFLTYKGDVYQNEDSNIKIKVYNNPTLSRVSKVNPDNFILFTGFSNLKENSVLDFYFDDTTEFFTSTNSKFAIDVNAFDDFYKQYTESFNALFNEENEILKTFGNNKYAFTTGLIHYNEIKTQYETKYELEVKTDFDFKSIVDVPTKTAHINVLTMNNYGYLNSEGFNIPKSNFETYLREYVTGEKQDFPVDGFTFFNILKKYSNGWVTFKDGDKFVTLHTERDIVYDFIFGNFLSEAEKKAKSIKEMYDIGENINIPKIAEELYFEFVSYREKVRNLKIGSILSETSRKIRVVSELDRFEFIKKSDNMYVNNVPTTEICNHAILFEDAFVKAKTKYLTNTESDFYCPYIQLFKINEEEDKFSVSVIADNSSKIKSVLYPDVGLKIAYGDINKNVPAGIMESKYQAIFTYYGKREINGAYMDVFSVRHGSKYQIKMAKLEEEIDKYFEAANMDVSGAKSKYRAIKEEQKELEAKIQNNIFKNIDVKPALKVSAEDNFIPFGVNGYIAFARGKILVSVDGSKWFEPYFTDNGLRLNNVMYVVNMDAFETTLQNMVLSDLANHSYYGKVIDDDLVDLNQISIKRIDINKDFESINVLFSFADVPCVYNDILYQPGELISATIKIDKDYDEINDNKRVVFFDGYIEYKTIYPVSLKNNISNAEEILNNENCFTVKHHLPCLLKMDSKGYMFETKTEALNAGVKMFFNFKGSENE